MEKERLDGVMTVEPQVAREDAHIGWKLFGILFLGLVLRLPGLFLHQASGDSLLYVALAMKLKTGGVEQYHVRGIQMREKSLDHSGIQHVLELSPAASTDPEGDFLRQVESEGMTAYNGKRFLLKPYGFPWVLAWVHSLTGYDARTGWNLVRVSVDPHDLLLRWPLALAGVQWYWLIIPLGCALLNILLVYRLCSKIFDETSGWMVAFFMAIHPLLLLTSQRIWADDLELSCCLGFCWAISIGKQKRTWGWMLLAGILLGMGYLTKQIVLLFGVSLFMVESIRWIRTKTPGSATLLGSEIVLWSGVGCGFLLVTAHWFWMEWETTGRIMNAINWRVEAPHSQWMLWLDQRPCVPILQFVGILLFTPVVLGMLRVWKNREVQMILLLACCYIGLLTLAGHQGAGGKEYRYVIPVIPFLIMAGVYGIREFWKKHPYWMLTLLPLNLGWSLYLSDRFIWRNWGELALPF